MQTEQKEQTTQGRMERSDYVVIYVRQTLRAMGDTRPLPENWLDLVTRFGQSDYKMIDTAHVAALELFGEYQYAESDPALYKVKKLTLEESQIAARMDLTHPEKIEAIKPLREKRKAAALVREGSSYKPSMYEIEYEARQQERVAAAVDKAMLISDADRAWAAECGFSL